MRVWSGAFLLVWSGCATHGAVDLQRGFEVSAMRAQLAEAAAADLQDRVVQMEDVLRQKGLDWENGTESIRQMQQDIAKLRGAVEELQFTIRELRADLESVQLDQERRMLWAEARLEQLEKMLGATPPPRPQLDPGVPGTAASGAEDGSGSSGGSDVAAPDDDAVTATAGSPAPGSFEERLALAEQRMEEGKQAAARAILEAALEAEPGSALSAEARYRLAETWFNEGRWREAAKAFQVVTEQHAKSPWAPWAMLRIGECFDQMNRPDAAKTFYEGVLRNYPASDAAKDAKRRLGR